jgi:hypothetical protein
VRIHPPITHSLIFVLLSCFTAFADIYVSPSGTGTTCSVTSPCSPSQGLANFPNGGSGIIHFASGSYPSGLDVQKSGGSQTSRLVLQCDAGLTSAMAAKGQCIFAGKPIMIEGNNIDVVGFDIGNNPNMGVAVDCISNSGSSGNSCHVIGNYVHDLGANVFSSSGAGGAGCPENGAIHFQSGDTDVQALRNVVMRFGSLAARSNNCNFAQAIYASGSPGAVFENNIVVQPVVGGIVLGASCNAVISNNTIINAKDAIIFGTHDNSRCSGGVGGHNTVANNAIFGSANAAIFNVGGTPDCSSSSPTLISHNITDGSGSDFSPSRTSCDTVAPLQMVHVSATQFFVNYQPNGTGDYHLNSGMDTLAVGATTCVTGGKNPCTPANDFEGVLRSALSVGVFESGGAVSAPAPPTGLSASVQ